MNANYNILSEKIKEGARRWSQNNKELGLAGAMAIALTLPNVANAVPVQVRTTIGTDNITYTVTNNGPLNVGDITFDLRGQPFNLFVGAPVGWTENGPTGDNLFEYGAIQPGAQIGTGESRTWTFLYDGATDLNIRGTEPFLVNAQNIGGTTGSAQALRIANNSQTITHDASEPATLGVVGAGILALAGMGARRRRNNYK